MHAQQFFKANILPLKHVLYRLALRVTGRADEAEDVVQEVMVRLWNMREQWHAIENMEAWANRAVRNLAIDKLRSKHRQCTTAAPEHWDAPASAATPYEAVAATDTLGYVRSLMQRLPPRQREVMTLRDIEEMSYQEISDLLDMPLGQVKTNLFRARSAVRGWMKDL